MSRLLVDTNVAIWMLLGDRERISSDAKLALEKMGNSIHVSAASVWEIAIKRSIGKLRIEGGWGATLSRIGLEPLPVTALHAEAVEELPWHHRDPFDRLLVAQAFNEEMIVLTPDEQFDLYGVPVLW